MSNGLVAANGFALPLNPFVIDVRYHRLIYQPHPFTVTLRPPTTFYLLLVLAALSLSTADGTGSRWRPRRHHGEDDLFQRLGSLPQQFKWKGATLEVYSRHILGTLILRPASGTQPPAVYGSRSDDDVLELAILEDHGSGDEEPQILRVQVAPHGRSASFETTVEPHQLDPATPGWPVVLGGVFGACALVAIVIALVSKLVAKHKASSQVGPVEPPEDPFANVPLPGITTAWPDDVPSDETTVLPSAYNANTLPPISHQKVDKGSRRHLKTPLSPAVAVLCIYAIVYSAQTVSVTTRTVIVYAPANLAEVRVFIRDEESTIVLASELLQQSNYTIKVRSFVMPQDGFNLSNSAGATSCVGSAEASDLSTGGAVCDRELGVFLCDTGSNHGDAQSRQGAVPLCPDIDECASSQLSPCPNHSTCMNNNGSFRCMCHPGFVEIVVDDAMECRCAEPNCAGTCAPDIASDRCGICDGGGSSCCPNQGQFGASCQLPCNFSRASNCDLAYGVPLHCERKSGALMGSCAKCKSAFFGRFCEHAYDEQSGFFPDSSNLSTGRSPSKGTCEGIGESIVAVATAIAVTENSTLGTQPVACEQPPFPIIQERCINVNATSAYDEGFAFSDVNNSKSVMCLECPVGYFLKKLHHLTCKDSSVLLSAECCASTRSLSSEGLCARAKLPSSGILQCGGTSAAAAVSICLASESSPIMCPYPGDLHLAAMTCCDRLPGVDAPPSFVSAPPQDSTSRPIVVRAPREEGYAIIEAASQVVDPDAGRQGDPWAVLECVLLSHETVLRSGTPTTVTRPLFEVSEREGTSCTPIIARAVHFTDFGRHTLVMSTRWREGSSFSPSIATVVIDIVGPLWRLNVFPADKVNVEESTPIGKIVGYVLPSPEEIDVAYSLANPTSPFSVDPRTGAIAIQQALRFDDANEHRLHVVAEDVTGITMGLNLTIVVQDTNDPPEFSLATSDVILLEDTPSTIQLILGLGPGALSEDWQSVRFIIESRLTTPSTPSGVICSISISPDGLLAVSPCQDAVGTVSFLIMAVDDGGTAHGGNNQSFPSLLTIHVEAVNDEPIVAQTLFHTSRLDDVYHRRVEKWALPGPENEAEQELSLRILHVKQTEHMVFASMPTLTPEGDLLLSLAERAFGTAQVRVKVSDNDGASIVVELQLLSEHVPMPPVCQPSTGHLMVTECSNCTVSSFAGFVDITPQPLGIGVFVGDVTVWDPRKTLESLALFGNGDLEFEPISHASGDVEITFSCRDGFGQSVVQSFNLTITNINEPPSFNLLQSNITTTEGGGTFCAAIATEISAGFKEDEFQKVHFTVTPITVDDPELFLVPPEIGPDGILCFTAAPHRHGTATMEVGLEDDGGFTTVLKVGDHSYDIPVEGGGVNSSPTVRLKVQVLSFNDPPQVRKPAFTILEEGRSSVIEDFVGPGPVCSCQSSERHRGAACLSCEERHQLVHAPYGLESVSSSEGTNPIEGVTLLPNGSLQVNLVVDLSGCSNVSGKICDNGGADHEDSKCSILHSQVCVLPVNDCPTVSSNNFSFARLTSGISHRVAGFSANFSAGPQQEPEVQSVSAKLICRPDRQGEFFSQTGNNATVGMLATIEIGRRDRANSLKQEGELIVRAPQNFNQEVVCELYAMDSGGTAHGGCNRSFGTRFQLDLCPPPTVNHTLLLGQLLPEGALVELGNKVTVEAQLRDAWYRPVRWENSSVSLRLSQNASFRVVLLESAGAGFYQGTWQVNRTGLLHAMLLVDGFDALAEPINVVVAPSLSGGRSSHESDARPPYVLLPGLPLLHQWANGRVLVKHDGNNLPGPLCEDGLSGAAALAICTSVYGPHEGRVTDVAVNDNGETSWASSANCTAPTLSSCSFSNWTVTSQCYSHLSCHSNPDHNGNVSSSPPPSPNCSVVTGPSEVTHGEEEMFIVHLRACKAEGGFRNETPASCSDCRIDADLLPIAMANTNPGLGLIADVLYPPNGRKYERHIAVRPPNPGEYELHVQIDGQPVQGTPLRVHVHPGLWSYRPSTGSTASPTQLSLQGPFQNATEVTVVVGPSNSPLSCENITFWKANNTATCFIPPSHGQRLEVTIMVQHPDGVIMFVFPKLFSFPEPQLFAATATLSSTQRFLSDMREVASSTRPKPQEQLVIILVNGSAFGTDERNILIEANGRPCRILSSHDISDSVIRCAVDRPQLTGNRNRELSLSFGRSSTRSSQRHIVTTSVFWPGHEPILSAFHSILDNITAIGPKMVSGVLLRDQLGNPWLEPLAEEDLHVQAVHHESGGEPVPILARAAAGYTRIWFKAMAGTGVYHLSVRRGSEHINGSPATINVTDLEGGPSFQRERRSGDSAKTGDDGAEGEVPSDNRDVVRPLARCNDTITLQALTGEVKLGGSGEQYGPRLNCSWVMPSRSDIDGWQLNFTSFNTELVADVVDIRRGPECAQRQSRVGLFSGSALPENLFLDDPGFCVMFTSDATIAGDGFVFRYRGVRKAGSTTAPPSKARAAVVATSMSAQVKLEGDEFKLCDWHQPVKVRIPSCDRPHIDKTESWKKARLSCNDYLHTCAHGTTHDPLLCHKSGKICFNTGPRGKLLPSTKFNMAECLKVKGRSGPHWALLYHRCCELRYSTSVLYDMCTQCTTKDNPKYDESTKMWSPNPSSVNHRCTGNGEDSLWQRNLQFNMKGCFPSRQATVEVEICNKNKDGSVRPCCDPTKYEAKCQNVSSAVHVKKQTHRVLYDAVAFPKLPLRSDSQNLSLCNTLFGDQAITADQMCDSECVKCGDTLCNHGHEVLAFEVSLRSIDPSANSDQIIVHNHSSPTFDIVSPLRPARKYELIVTPFYDDGPGPSWLPVTFRTLADVPDSPNITQLLAINRTAIQVQWNMPQDNGFPVTNVTIEVVGMYRNRTAIWLPGVNKNDSPTLVVGNLAMNDTVRVRLRASSAFGDGPWTNLSNPLAEVQTHHCSGLSTWYASQGVLTDGSGASRPYAGNLNCIFEVHIEGASSIALEAQMISIAPSDEFQVYQRSINNTTLLLEHKGSFPDNGEVVVVPSNWIFLTFSSTSDRSNGEDGFAISYSGGHNTPCRPSDPHVVNITDSRGVYISWKPPRQTSACHEGRSPSSYLLIVFPAETGPGWQGPVTATISSSETTALATGLTPGNKYTILIHAENDMGRGPPAHSALSLQIPSCPAFVTISDTSGILSSERLFGEDEVFASACHWWLRPTKPTTSLRLTLQSKDIGGANPLFVCPGNLSACQLGGAAEQGYFLPLSSSSVTVVGSEAVVIFMPRTYHTLKVRFQALDGPVVPPSPQHVSAVVSSSADATLRHTVLLRWHQPAGPPESPPIHGFKVTITDSSNGELLHSTMILGLRVDQANVSGIPPGVFDVSVVAVNNVGDSPYRIPLRLWVDPVVCGGSVREIFLGKGESTSLTDGRGYHRGQVVIGNNTIMKPCSWRWKLASVVPFYSLHISLQAVSLHSNGFLDVLDAATNASVARVTTSLADTMSIQTNSAMLYLVFQPGVSSASQITPQMLAVITVSPLSSLPTPAGFTASVANKESRVSETPFVAIDGLNASCDESRYENGSGSNISCAVQQPTPSQWVNASVYHLSWRYGGSDCDPLPANLTFELVLFDARFGTCSDGETVWHGAAEAVFLARQLQREQRNWVCVRMSANQMTSRFSKPIRLPGVEPCKQSILEPGSNRVSFSAGLPRTQVCEWQLPGASEAWRTFITVRSIEAGGQVEIQGRQNETLLRVRGHDHMPISAWFLPQMTLAAAAGFELDHSHGEFKELARAMEVRLRGALLQPSTPFHHTSRLATSNVFTVALVSRGIVVPLQDGDVKAHIPRCSNGGQATVRMEKIGAASSRIAFAVEGTSLGSCTLVLTAHFKEENVTIMPLINITFVPGSPSAVHSRVSLVQGQKLVVGQTWVLGISLNDRFGNAVTTPSSIAKVHGYVKNATAQLIAVPGYSIGLAVTAKSPGSYQPNVFVDGVSLDTRLMVLVREDPQMAAVVHCQEWHVSDEVVAVVGSASNFFNISVLAGKDRRACVAPNPGAVLATLEERGQGKLQLHGSAPGLVVVNATVNSDGARYLIQVVNTSTAGNYVASFGFQGGLQWRNVKIQVKPGLPVPQNCKVVLSKWRIKPGSSTSVMVRCHDEANNLVPPDSMGCGSLRNDSATATRQFLVLKGDGVASSTVQQVPITSGPLIGGCSLSYLPPQDEHLANSYGLKMFLGTHPLWQGTVSVTEPIPEGHAEHLTRLAHIVNNLPAGTALGTGNDMPALRQLLSWLRPLGECIVNKNSAYLEDSETDALLVNCTFVKTEEDGASTATAQVVAGVCYDDDGIQQAFCSAEVVGSVFLEENTMPALIKFLDDASMLPKAATLLSPSEAGLNLRIPASCQPPASEAKTISDVVDGFQIQFPSMNPAPSDSLLSFLGGSFPIHSSITGSSVELGASLANLSETQLQVQVAFEKELDFAPFVTLQRVTLVLRGDGTTEVLGGAVWFPNAKHPTSSSVTTFRGEVIFRTGGILDIQLLGLALLPTVDIDPSDLLDIMPEEVAAFVRELGLGALELQYSRFSQATNRSGMLKGTLGDVDIAFSMTNEVAFGPLTLDSVVISLSARNDHVDGVSVSLEASLGGIRLPPLSLPVLQDGKLPNVTSMTRRLRMTSDPRQNVRATLSMILKAIGTPELPRSLVAVLEGVQLSEYSVSLTSLDPAANLYVDVELLAVVNFDFLPEVVRRFLPMESLQAFTTLTATGDGQALQLKEMELRSQFGANGDVALSGQLKGGYALRWDATLPPKDRRLALSIFNVDSIELLTSLVKSIGVPAIDEIMTKVMEAIPTIPAIKQANVVLSPDLANMDEFDLRFTFGNLSLSKFQMQDFTVHIVGSLGDGLSLAAARVDLLAFGVRFPLRMKLDPSSFTLGTILNLIEPIPFPTIGDLVPPELSLGFLADVFTSPLVVTFLDLKLGFQPISFKSLTTGLQLPVRWWSNTGFDRFFRLASANALFRQGAGSWDLSLDVILEVAAASDRYSFAASILLPASGFTILAAGKHAGGKTGLPLEAVLGILGGRVAGAVKRVIELIKLTPTLEGITMRASNDLSSVHSVIADLRFGSWAPVGGLSFRDLRGSITCRFSDGDWDCELDVFASCDFAGRLLPLSWSLPTLAGFSGLVTLPEFRLPTIGSLWQILIELLGYGWPQLLPDSLTVAGLPFPTPPDLPSFGTVFRAIMAILPDMRDFDWSLFPGLLKMALRWGAPFGLRQLSFPELVARLPSLELPLAFPVPQLSLHGLPDFGNFITSMAAFGIGDVVLDSIGTMSLPELLARFPQLTLNGFSLEALLKQLSGFFPFLPKISLPSVILGLEAVIADIALGVDPFRFKLQLFVPSFGSILSSALLDVLSLEDVELSVVADADTVAVNATGTLGLGTPSNREFFGFRMTFDLDADLVLCEVSGRDGGISLGGLLSAVGAKAILPALRAFPGNFESALRVSFIRVAFDSRFSKLRDSEIGLLAEDLLVLPGIQLVDVVLNVSTSSKRTSGAVFNGLLQVGAESSAFSGSVLPGGWQFAAQVSSSLITELLAKVAPTDALSPFIPSVSASMWLSSQPFSIDELHFDAGVVLNFRHGTKLHVPAVIASVLQVEVESAALFIPALEQSQAAFSFSAQCRFELNLGVLSLRALAYVEVEGQEEPKITLNVPHVVMELPVLNSVNFAVAVVAQRDTLSVDGHTVGPLLAFNLFGYEIQARQLHLSARLQGGKVQFLVVTGAVSVGSTLATFSLGLFGEGRFKATIETNGGELLEQIVPGPLLSLVPLEIGSLQIMAIGGQIAIEGLSPGLHVVAPVNIAGGAVAAVIKSVALGTLPSEFELKLRVPFDNPSFFLMEIDAPSFNVQIGNLLKLEGISITLRPGVSGAPEFSVTAFAVLELPMSGPLAGTATAGYSPETNLVSLSLEMAPGICWDKPLSIPFLRLCNLAVRITLPAPCPPCIRSLYLSGQVVAAGRDYGMTTVVFDPVAVAYLVAWEVDELGMFDLLGLLTGHVGLGGPRVRDAQFSLCGPRDLNTGQIVHKAGLFVSGEVDIFGVRAHLNAHFIPKAGDIEAEIRVATDALSGLLGQLLSFIEDIAPELLRPLVRLSIVSISMSRVSLQGALTGQLPDVEVELDAFGSRHRISLASPGDFAGNLVEMLKDLPSKIKFCLPLCMTIPWIDPLGGTEIIRVPKLSVCEVPLPPVCPACQLHCNQCAPCFRFCLRYPCGASCGFWGCSVKWCSRCERFCVPKVPCPPCHVTCSKCAPLEVPCYKGEFDEITIPVPKATTLSQCVDVCLN